MKRTIALSFLLFTSAILFADYWWAPGNRSSQIQAPDYEIIINNRSGQNNGIQSVPDSTRTEYTSVQYSLSDIYNFHSSANSWLGFGPGAAISKTARGRTFDLKPGISIFLVTRWKVTTVSGHLMYLDYFTSTTGTAQGRELFAVDYSAERR